jgi:hypothetical protein
MVGWGEDSLLSKSVAGRFSEAEFLDQIQTKVLRGFLLAIQSHLYSFALTFLFLQTHATSYSFYSVLLLYTVKEKGGKPDRKPHPLPRNQYRNLKSENSQDNAEKPQRNCTFMNSAFSGLHSRLFLLCGNMRRRNHRGQSIHTAWREETLLPVCPVCRAAHACC